MDNKRFILVFSLMFVVMLLWQEWQKDYGVQAPIDSQPPSVSSEEVPADPPASPLNGEMPTVKKRPPGILDNVQTTMAINREKQTVVVETDVYRIEIDQIGAGIRKLALVDHPVSIDQPEEPLVLLDNSQYLLHIVQGGLLGNGPSLTHEDLYFSGSSRYELKEGEQKLVVSFLRDTGEGVKAYKIYEFERGSYLINVLYRIENDSDSAWTGRSYAQLKRKDPGSTRSMMINTYTGAIFSTPENRYEKIDFDDMREQKLDEEAVNAWVAMIQHYFLAALIPVSKTDSLRYYTNALSDGGFAIGAITPGITVAPGEIGEIREQLYIGPKKQEVMAALADGLELTVDYGFLWFISKPLFRVMSFLQEQTGNWGWAIVLVTILLKLIFYPLSAAGYRSMANMRKIQPRIIALRDRYKDDKTKLNQAMMQIYKEEKVNPFGGCLPILVQIPVFIALYWALLESVEMRHAPFILWYNDLSSADPYFLLPVLMGVSMFIQQRLNPPPMDPVQAKVFMVLPFVFTVFFAFFPSGLVLYWVVNNILSIIQQWRITKMIERSGEKASPS